MTSDLGAARLDNLLDGLIRCRLPARHIVTLIAITRRVGASTSGEAPISSYQLAWETGYDRRGVQRILDDLELWGCIDRESAGRNKTLTLCINPWEGWLMGASCVALRTKRARLGVQTTNGAA